MQDLIQVFVHLKICSLKSIRHVNNCNQFINQIVCIVMIITFIDNSSIIIMYRVNNICLVVDKPHFILNLKSIHVQLIPRKLCDLRIAINYIPLCMAYYMFIQYSYVSLGSTVLICTSKERHYKEERCGVGNFEFEPVIRKLRRLF